MSRLGITFGRRTQKRDNWLDHGLSQEESALDFIETLQFFDVLEEPLDHLASRAVIRSYKMGDTIFSKDEPICTIHMASVKIPRSGKSSSKSRSDLKSSWPEAPMDSSEYDN